MHHQGIECRRFLGQHARGFTIDAQGQGFFVLGPVHCGVSRSIDDHIGAQLAHQRTQRLRISQIGAGAIERNHLSQRLHGACELPANLPAGSGDQNLHANTSAWASGTPT